MSVLSTSKRVRRKSYAVGRTLGNVNALASGDPTRILKRQANRWVWRHVVRHIWLR